MNQGTVLALGKRQSRADFPLRVVELNLLALASDFVDYSDPISGSCGTVTIEDESKLTQQ
jgi:hypothetical protein